MEPVTPVLGPEFQSKELTFAKDQPAYRPVPAHRNSSGVLISRWRLNETERAAIAAGADIFLSSYTRNELLLPVMIEVGNCDRDIIEMAIAMELIEDKDKWPWVCETCEARYPEYINGCIYCEQHGRRSGVRNQPRERL